MTYRLKKGKSVTFFYSVEAIMNMENSTWRPDGDSVKEGFRLPTFFKSLYVKKQINVYNQLSKSQAGKSPTNPPYTDRKH